MAKKTERDIDAHIGERLRMARNLRGVSQPQLAEACGDITFQQIQKYEKGTNRIGGSRFVQISEALDVPVSYFFEGLKQGKSIPEMPPKEVLDMASAIEGLEPGQKTAIRTLLKALAG